MRIDCHNDTALFLREKETLALLPKAHFDWERLRRYLDVAFCAIFIHEKEYHGQVEASFQTILQHLNRDIAAQSDMETLLYREQLEKERVGKTLILISMEGASPLGENGSFFDDYYAQGLRSIGLTWNYNNAYGASAMEGGRMTQAGRALVARCNSRGVLLDAAHCSSGTFVDLLRFSSQPIIDSHVVCGALCSDWPRCLSDDQFRHLAAKGGVAGIAFVPDFLGGLGDLNRLCEHIEYAVSLVGSAHVALGSDFDGAKLHREYAGVQFLPILYERLRQRGMSEEDLKNVQGESVRRLLRQVLPSRTA